MVKRRNDDLTIDMWSEFIPPAVAVSMEPEITKGGTLDVKIARALSHAMQNCDKSREEIAAEMSDYLGGQNVTLNMLQTYASPARRDHKITLERFIAFVAVTGCHDLLGFVAEFSDYAVVPEEYLDVINLSEAERLAEKAIAHRDQLLCKVRGRYR